jgi:hypothetical protein
VRYNDEHSNAYVLTDMNAAMGGDIVVGLARSQ